MTVVVRTNYIANPSVTTTLDAQWNNGGSASTVTRDTTQFNSTPASVKVVNTGASAGVIARVTDPMTWTGLPISGAFMIKGTAGVTMSVDMRAPTVLPGTTVTFVLTGAWQRVDVPGAIAISGSLPFMFIRGGAIGNTFWVDDAQIEQALYVGSLFNGSTPSVPGTVYAWAGAANASLSTMTVTTADVAPSGLWAILDNRARPLEVVDYTVSQALNGYAPDDTSGGTASMTITVKANEDDVLYRRYLASIDHKITLYDVGGIPDTAFKGRGSWTGTISQATRAGGRITFAVDSILNKLNVSKVAKPFFGRARPNHITTYVVNLSGNPSFESNTTGVTAVPGTGGAGAITNAAVGDASSGAKVARYTWSTAATGQGGLVSTESGFTPGNQYTFGIDARTNAPQSLVLYVQWQTSASANIGSPVLGSQLEVDGTAAWNRFYDVGLVAPATAAKAQILVYNDPTGTNYHTWAIGNTLDIDAVMINYGQVRTPFADGNSPGGTWNGTANNSISTIAIDVPQDPGYDATFGNAIRYYCSLVGIPDSSVSVETELDGRWVTYPGWSGNVLDNIKLACSAQGAIFYAVNDVIQVETPHKRTVRIENVDQINSTVNAQGSARSVIVSNYNNQWLTDSVTYASDRLYSITVGAPTNFTVNVDDWLTSVNTPVCVAAITPLPYTSGTGQYVVTDSNNNAVDPDSWYAAGGGVSVEIDAVDRQQLNVGIHAPAAIAGYVSPFRLATFISNNDVPALYITGTGVFTEKTTETIVTGASVNTATEDQSPTVDNPYIGDVSTAHDRGMYAADAHGGTQVTGRFKFAFDPDSGGQEFGRIVGARFYGQDSIFVITNADITRSGISVDYKTDVTFDDLTNLYAMIFDEFNATYAGLTFSAFNAVYPTQTFDQFNAVSSNPTLDDFNAIYAGSTFNDHAVYPYIKAPLADPGISTTLRTNYVLDPDFQATGTQWTIVSGLGTFAPNVDPMQGAIMTTAAAGIAAGSASIYMRNALLPNYDGTAFSGAVYIKNLTASAKTFRANIYFYKTGLTTAVAGPNIVLNPGEEKLFYIDNATMPVGTDLGFRFVITNVTALASGEQIQVRGATTELVAAHGTTFSGNTPNVVPFTYGWAGTANQSNSTELTTINLGPGY